MGIDTEPRKLQPQARSTRPLYRQKIHIVRAVLKMFLPMVLISVFFLIAPRFTGDYAWPVGPVWLWLLSECVYVLLRLKSIIIWLVRVYQHYAPDDVRHLCLYTPSCSEYMILAVEKYGPFRGFMKGIDRLSRCGSDSGGEDWP